MRSLIKQILKEETSDIKPALIRAFYGFMEMETEGYEIYVDTPKNRFKYTPESIWIINPKTKGWIIELENSGRVWCYNRLYDNFLNWFNEEQSVFEQLITMWVEDVIKRGVSTTHKHGKKLEGVVGDVIKRGVSTTVVTQAQSAIPVEDVIKRGVSTTRVTTIGATDEVEDVLKK